MGEGSVYVFYQAYSCFVLLYSSESSNCDKQTAQGEGGVHVNGSIIDSACSIDVDSREQSIDMGDDVAEYYSAKWPRVR